MKTKAELEKALNKALRNRGALLKRIEALEDDVAALRVEVEVAKQASFMRTHKEAVEKQRGGFQYSITDPDLAELLKRQQIVGL